MVVVHFFKILRYISVDRSMDSGKISKKNISTWTIFGRMVLKISKCRCKIENVIKKFIMLYYTNNLYPIPLGVYIHDRQCNMRAERPVFCLEHPKLCWRKHRSFWHVFWPHTGVHEIFDLGGVGAPNFACSLDLICVNRQHAVCVCVCVGWCQENWFQADFHRPRKSNLILFHETVKIDETWIFFVYTPNR